MGSFLSLDTGELASSWQVSAVRSAVTAVGAFLVQLHSIVSWQRTVAGSRPACSSQPASTLFPNGFSPQLSVLFSTVFLLQALGAFDSCALPTVEACVAVFSVLK